MLHHVPTTKQYEAQVLGIQMNGIGAGASWKSQICHHISRLESDDRISLLASAVHSDQNNTDLMYTDALGISWLRTGFNCFPEP